MELGDYRALLAKVEAFSERVRARYGSGLTCHAGCSGCCHVDLTVCDVEAEAIRTHLRALPDAARARLAAKERVEPSACVALDADGRCAIYEARPVICRTQGLPMRVERRGLPVLDVCPLNFEGTPLESLEADCLLDVRTIDAILGVVNVRAGADPERRTRIADLLRE